MGIRKLALLLALLLLVAGCGGGSSGKDGMLVERPLPAHMEEAVAASAVATDYKVKAEMAALRRRLNAYLAEQEGTYGVYVIDLTSGRAVSINGNMTFQAASTFKLPMALYILDQVERGNASLDEMLAFTWEDWEDGTGILQESEEGDRFSVRELVELSLTLSDNIATNMLLRRFGLSNVLAHMQHLGGKVADLDAGTIVTTPRDMATYMSYVQSDSGLHNEELRAFLLGALEHTAFTDRVAAGVPDGIPVAHKIGTLPGVVNDVGLVLAPDRPFIIAAFSMDVWEDDAAEVIAGITRTVYEFFHGS